MRRYTLSNGKSVSKTHYYRLLKKSAALGVAMEDLPDGRGKHCNHPKGEKHRRWSKKIETSHHYIKIRVGKDHPLADPNGYAYEHLVVWASAGNKLPDGTEVIHHRNENKSDNRLSNLELKTRYAHSVDHHTSITDEQVKDIRQLYASRQFDMPHLAEMYNCSVKRISKYIRGDVRKQAGGPVFPSDKRKAAGRLLDSVEHNEFPKY